MKGIDVWIGVLVVAAIVSFVIVLAAEITRAPYERAVELRKACEQIGGVVLQTRDGKNHCVKSLKVPASFSADH